MFEVLAAHDHLASYMSAGSECSLLAVHQHQWNSGGIVWLPRVQGGDMSWHPVQSEDQLQEGFKGIYEPNPELVSAETLPQSCLVFVPGVGFTRSGKRLGQGGGFYDRFLAQRHDVISVGVAFSVQLVADIPTEDFDQIMTHVIANGVVYDALAKQRFNDGEGLADNDRAATVVFVIACFVGVIATPQATA